MYVLFQFYLFIYYFSVFFISVFLVLVAAYINNKFTNTLILFAPNLLMYISIYCCVFTVLT